MTLRRFGFVDRSSIASQRPDTRRSAAVFRIGWQVLYVAALFCVPACAPDDNSVDPSENETTENLRLGSITHARPAVGRVKRNDGHWCTATLVDTRVVLTAAHCMSYTDNAAGGSTLGQFRIERWIDGVRHFYYYDFDGFKSFATTTGSDDLALVHLALDVPSTIATPLAIGTTEPPLGATVTVFGYGYTDCYVDPDTGIVNTGALDGYKRRYSYAWGYPSNALCSGDSGGPTLYDGQVVAVNSGKHWDGTDLFAHVYDWDDALLRQIAAW